MARTAPQSIKNASIQPAATPGGAPGVLMGLDEEQRGAQLPPLALPEPVKTVRANNGPEPVAAPIPRYRVQVERRIMHRGSMVMLRAGKVVDQRNYNVQDLMSQGVQLQEI